MERVTDEWLWEVDGKAGDLADEQYPHAEDFQEWAAACRLAVAQAIARECIEVIMCFNDRDEGVRHIRARFGLEE